MTEIRDNSFASDHGTESSFVATKKLEYLARMQIILFQTISD